MNTSPTAPADESARTGSAVELTNDNARDLVAGWMDAFETALTAGDRVGLTPLFAEESYLRDLGSFTWDWRQFHGRDAVLDELLGLDEMRPRGFRLSTQWPAPEVNDGPPPIVVAFIDFETDLTTGVFVLNGVLDPDAEHGFRARVLAGRLEGLRVPAPEDEDPLAHRPVDGEIWSVTRERKRGYVDAEPDVLIVGAGHSGLFNAAHLDKLGVSTLVIDKHPRVGDNWRTRYSSLKLHNPTPHNAFPFMPFPDHLPTYWPRDMVADWIEIYARYLDLNVWTSTELVSGVYDDDARRWDATVRLADGSIRVFHPKEILEATGVTGGKPKIPALAGLDDFAGDVVHSHHFTGTEAYPDVHRVVVVGMGSSGHDIALAFAEEGVDVTMVQRSPTIYSSLEASNLAYGDEYFDGVTPAELPDLRRIPGSIAPLQRANLAALHVRSQEFDRELVEGARRAGVTFWDGRDGGGWVAEFINAGGGYYFNSGAADAVIDGRIKILQNDRIVRYVADGVELDDGSVIPADLLVMATGYENRVVDIRSRFGDEVAERIGAVAVVNEEGEWNNVYRPTPQRGLWFSGSGFAQVRRSAQVTALLIKASALGLIPDAVYERLTAMPELAPRTERAAR